MPSPDSSDRTELEPAPAITCLVADDHTAVAKLLTRFLEEEGIGVVAVARDGKEALAKIETTAPAVALLDLKMPELDGVEVARRAPHVSAETAIILYTGFAERAHLSEALDAGARGFVQKEATLEEVLRAIQTVAGGGIYVDPVLGGIIVNASSTSEFPQLSQRERDVLRLLADGLRYEAIGKRLFLSPETVRTYTAKAMRKLEAETRTQAVATALRESLIA